MSNISECVSGYFKCQVSVSVFLDISGVKMKEVTVNVGCHIGLTVFEFC